jgi:CRP-like cAMP-binding protein
VFRLLADNFNSNSMDLDMRDSFWYLKNCDLFSRLAPQDIAEIESQSRMRQLKRGEPVYLPDEQADGVLLVAQGRVKICHATPDGKQSILGFIDAGEIFGELALLGGERRDEYVETTEKTTLVLIPKQTMQQIVHRYPELVLGVTKLIGMRRQKIQRRLRNLLFRSSFLKSTRNRHQRATCSTFASPIRRWLASLEARERQSPLFWDSFKRKSS